jgi:hypothetical protein
VKRRWLVATAVVTCAAGVACANVLGIPNATASWCSVNTGHTYCEDFDLGDPLSRMSFHAATGGASLTIAPSDDSPPNLLDLKTPALGPTGASLAGYDEEFDNSQFGSLHIECDMRIVTANGKAFDGNVGIMLISDKAGGCIGLAMEPAGIGAVTAGSPDACSSLIGSNGSGVMLDAETLVPDGGDSMVATRLGAVPPLNQWVHLKVDVVPNLDGSGTFTIDIVGALAGYIPLTIPAKTLAKTGTPLVGFSVAGLASTGAAEIQYDNITMDLKAL